MPPKSFDRRSFLAVCSAAGVSSTLFPGVLWAMTRKPKHKTRASLRSPATRGAAAPVSPAQDGKAPLRITRDMIDSAAAIAGITIADEHKDMMLRDLNDQVHSYQEIRKLGLANGEQYALRFDPVLRGQPYTVTPRPMRLSPI